MARFDIETLPFPEQSVDAPRVAEEPTVESQGPVAVFFSDYDRYQEVPSTREVMTDVRSRIGGEAAVTIRAMCTVCTSHRAARAGMTYSNRPTKNEANQGE